MAVRPVFMVSLDQRICIRENIEFEFFNGFSDQQKKRCIRSLHKEFLEKYSDRKVLEISSKSEEELGVALSAFQLKMKLGDGREVSVESAFQASKVFERGGPYVDLLNASSKAAKKDERLKNSGKILAFQLEGERYAAEPKTFFYQWLYLHALHLHPELAEPLMAYDAFTDIVFHPQKSINCQAEAAAVYVSLKKQGLLEKALDDQTYFKKIYGSSSI